MAIHGKAGSPTSAVRFCRDQRGLPRPSWHNIEGAAPRNESYVGPRSAVSDSAVGDKGVCLTSETGALLRGERRSDADDAAGRLT